MPDYFSEGYLALPPSGEGPGVLVLHAWWGLSDMIKEFCDRLAGEGFVAYAPDLFQGKHAATIEEAETLVGQVEAEGAEKVKAIIAAAVEELKGEVKSRNRFLGVVGFSFGAYYALQLSCDDPESIQAVVLFYGTGDGDFSRSKANYLGHYAENDPFESVEQVDWLEKALTSADRPATFYRYPGAGHWFFEPDRPEAFKEEEARLAWERTVVFLKNELPPVVR